MFFKKKSQPVEKVNAYDVMYNEKLAKMQSSNLRKSVSHVLAAQQAVLVYPDTPEREEAMKRLEETKRLFLNEYKAYTECRDDVINFFKEYQYDMDKCFESEPTLIPTAHYLVELECQRYFQK